MILAPIPLSLAIALDSPVRRGLEAPAGAHPYIATDAYAAEKDAAAVRRFVRQNMLFGVMAMQNSPSVRAYDSIVRALRVAKAAAYIEGLDDVVRVIDGCEGPLHAIHQRHDAGRLAMGHHEHITLRAVGQVVADAIDVMPDRAMIIAYETVEAERAEQRLSKSDLNAHGLTAFTAAIEQIRLSGD